MSFPITVAQTGDILSAFIEVLKWGTGAIGTSQLSGYAALQSGGANAGDGVLNCTVYHPSGSQAVTVTDQGNGLYLAQYTSIEAGIHVFQWDTSAPLAQQNVYKSVVLVGETWISRLDAAISTRLATSGYTAPPNVNAIADQVWDELLSGHTISGSAGAALTTSAGVNDPAVTAAAVWNEVLTGHTTTATAGKVLQNLDGPVSGIADPLTHTVPGSYGAGTAGLAISKLYNVGTASPISIVSPVAIGGSITLFVGVDYYSTDGFALVWTDPGHSFPDVMTGSSSEFRVVNPTDPSGATDFTKSVTVAPLTTGTTKTATLELSRSEVASIYALFKAGTTTFEIITTLSNGHKRPLVYAPMYFLV
jgi:hypothetical protein